MIINKKVVSIKIEYFDDLYSTFDGKESISYDFFCRNAVKKGRKSKSLYLKNCTLDFLSHPLDFIKNFNNLESLKLENVVFKNGSMEILLNILKDANIGLYLKDIKFIK